jgi:hypothetical protein
MNRSFLVRDNPSSLDRGKFRGWEGLNLNNQITLKERKWSTLVLTTSTKRSLKHVSLPEGRSCELLSTVESEEEQGNHVNR